MSKHILTCVTLVLAFFLAVPSYAQMKLAAEKTAPFSAVKTEGDKTMVLVEGKWYEPLAINNMPAGHIIDYCKHKYGDDWLKRFSEDLVEVMQDLDNPMYELVTLQLLDNGQRETKKVIVNEKKRKAAWEYNNTHELPKAAKTKATTGSSVQRNLTKLTNFDKNKPFQFKTAMIEYIYTGNDKYTGKEVMHIENYGETVIVAIDKPGIGGHRELKTLVWHNNKTLEVNHITKTYKTYAIRPKATEPPTIAYSTELQRKQAGYVNKGTQQIAEHTCTVYENPKTNVTYWLWNGIDLKMDNGSLGSSNSYKKIATAVIEGHKFPRSLLSPPEGYKKQ